MTDLLSQVTSLASAGMWEEIDRLLDEQPALAQVTDRFGTTALMAIAGFPGATAIVRKLIALGANVNQVDSTGASAVGRAISGGHRYGLSTGDNLLELIRGGLDFSVVAQNGHPPLHWAIYERNVDAIKLLLKAGADVETKNIYGQTPADFAKELGAKDVMGLFVQ